jgi:hypothetical protein
MDILRARLDDPELESRFQQATLDERRRPTVSILVCVALISLVCLIPDALVLDQAPGLKHLNRTLSIGFTLVSFALAAAVLKTGSAERLNLLLTIWWLTAIGVICLGNTSYPAGNSLFIALDILIPVAIYFLFPVGLLIQTGLAILFTFLDLSVFVNGQTLEPGNGAFVIVAFIAAHGIGIVTCRHLHISRRRQFLLHLAEQQQRHKAESLLQEVQALRGILPICSYCKQIRDDEGYWHEVETYVAAHSEADFSHGICPVCMSQHFPREHAQIYPEVPPVEE